MTVVDFIDVIDDIIDLSSDEETVEQHHIATQPQATLLDQQAVFVLAGEGRQDVQAAFVSAGEASQAATESGNALVATPSPSVPLDTAVSKNCPSSPPSASLPSPASTPPKAPTSEVGDTPLVAPSVMEKMPLDTAKPKNGPSSPASAPLPGSTSTTSMALTSEVGDTHLATASPSVMEKAPFHTAESKNCRRLLPSKFSVMVKASLHTAESKSCRRLLHSKFSVMEKSPLPAPVAVHSPTSITPTALTSEVGDAQLVATASPSVLEKAPLDTAESKNLRSSPASAPLPSPASATPKALTSEDGAKKRVRVKHPKKSCHTGTPRRSPRLLEELSASAPLPGPTSTTSNALTSEVGDTHLATASPSVMEKAPLDTAESKNSPSSPASAPLHSPASATPKALTSEDGATKRVRVKYLKKNYHTGTPRRSPRLRECCDNPVEELSAEHKRSRMLEPAEESASSVDNAQSTTTLSTDSTH